MHDRYRAVDAWVRRLLPATPPAILLGVGSPNDLSMLRSFARRGIPVLHLVSGRLIGSFSRFGVRVRMPPVEWEPEEWLGVLDRIASALGSPAVLFALMDEHCELVARHAERLRGKLRFVVPDAETCAGIIDKRRQYTTAEAASVRVPLTFYPEDVGELASLSPGLAYPVILKLYTSYIGRPQIGNRKVLVVDGPHELLAAFAACTASGARFMVQQIVPGGDDAIFWYSGFWDEEGRERAWFTVQKLRQLPGGFGDGCLQQTVDAPAVAADSRHLLTAFRYRGLVMVEFKRDPRDGAQFLMEINPRTVSGNQLGITAGVDLAWIAYRHLLGLDGGTCPPTFRAGVRYVNEEWDVLAFWEARAARRLTFWAWVRSLVGVRAWAIAAWDDPGPLLMGLWRMVVRMCGGRKSTT
jgi:predicted ATP-grasp superfamily ATP-dependent carboligase